MVRLLKRRIWTLLLMVFTMSFVLACQPERVQPRNLFAEAEEAYRQGHYDLAIERYEAFIKAAPNHQLAPLAEQRKVNLVRQLEIVLDRKGPRPIYLRPTLQTTPPENDPGTPTRTLTSQPPPRNP